MTDEQIIDYVADGHHPDDVARYVIEEQAAAGEFGGPDHYDDVQMEIAYGENQARVQRVVAAAGGA